jgi:glycosyltransferase involved in cell wall biosynthesis
MFHPLVSIVIPVYNGANYLREAIDSALAQTYDNCEVLVINDGSDDNGATEALARSYGDRVRYFYKENCGVASAVNYGLKKMRGDYFSWLSHDDWYKPEKISKQVEELKNSPDYISCTGYAYYQQQTKREYQIFNNLDFSSLRALMRHLFWPEVNIATMLIPKNLMFELGCFDESCVTTQDYTLIFKMIKHGCKFKQLRDVLVVMRHHAGQGTLGLTDLHMRELNRLYSDACQLFLDELAHFDLETIEHLKNSMFTRQIWDAFFRVNGIASYIRFKSASGREKPFLWLYWENAPGSSMPAVLRHCFVNICAQCGNDFSVILLDECTVTLFAKTLHPRWRDFRQIAHRADYIRFVLLEHFGGIWLDIDQLLFKSLAPVLDKIKEVGFVCTGYPRDAGGVFPLISFLGCLPHNDIAGKMVRHFHCYMDVKLAAGRQPAWDELGGNHLAGLLTPQNHYLYPAEFFYPIPVYHAPEQLLLPPELGLDNALGKAFGQSLANSVISPKSLFFFWNNHVSHKVALGKVYAKAFAGPFSETRSIILRIGRSRLFSGFKKTNLFQKIKGTKFYAQLRKKLG